MVVAIPVNTVLIVVHVLLIASEIVVQMLLNVSVKNVHKLVKISDSFANRSSVAVLILSQFVATVKASNATSAITTPTGPVTAVIAADNTGASVTIEPTIDNTVPIAVSSGPIAATIPAIMSTVCCCPSDKPFHFSISEPMASVTFCIMDASAGPAVFTRSAPTVFN